MVPQYPHLNFEPYENNAWKDCQRFFATQLPEVLQACDELFELANKGCESLREFIQHYEDEGLGVHEKSQQFYTRAQQIKDDLSHTPSISAHWAVIDQTKEQWLQSKKEMQSFDSIVLAELVIFALKALSYQNICDWYLSFGNAVELFNNTEFSRLNVQVAVCSNTLHYFLSKHENI